jgi:hypothetical protein
MNHRRRMVRRARAHIQPLATCLCTASAGQKSSLIRSLDDAICICSLNSCRAGKAVHISGGLLPCIDTCIALSVCQTTLLHRAGERLPCACYTIKTRTSSLVCSPVCTKHRAASPDRFYCCASASPRHSGDWKSSKAPRIEWRPFRCCCSDAGLCKRRTDRAPDEAGGLAWAPATADAVCYAPGYARAKAGCHHQHAGGLACFGT